METFNIIFIIFVLYAFAIIYVTDVIGDVIKQISEEWFDYDSGKVFRRMCIILAPLTFVLSLVVLLLFGFVYLIDEFRNF